MVAIFFFLSNDQFLIWAIITFQVSKKENHEPFLFTSLPSACIFPIHDNYSQIFQTCLSLLSLTFYYQILFFLLFPSYALMSLDKDEVLITLLPFHTWIFISSFLRGLIFKLLSSFFPFSILFPHHQKRWSWQCLSITLRVTEK